MKLKQCITIVLMLVAVINVSAQLTWRLTGRIKERIYLDPPQIGYRYLDARAINIRLYVDTIVGGNRVSLSRGEFFFDNESSKPRKTSIRIINNSYQVNNEALLKNVDLFWVGAGESQDLPVEIENKKALADYTAKIKPKANQNIASEKENITASIAKVELRNDDSAKKLLDYSESAFISAYKLVDTMAVSASKVNADKEISGTIRSIFNYFFGSADSAYYYISKTDTSNLTYYNSLLHGYLSEIKYLKEGRLMYQEEARRLYWRASRLKEYKDYYSLEMLSDFILRSQKTKEVIPVLKTKLNAIDFSTRGFNDSIYTLFQLSQAYFWAPMNYPGTIVKDSSAIYAGKIIQEEQRIIDSGNRTSLTIFLKAYKNFAGNKPDSIQIPMMTKIIPVATAYESGDNTSLPPNIHFSVPDIYYELALAYDDDSLSSNPDSSYKYYLLASTAYRNIIEKNPEKLNWILSDLSLVYLGIMDSDFIHNNKKKKFASAERKALRKLAKKIKDADQKAELEELEYSLK